MISLIIPVYNEEAVIDLLYQRCTDAMQFCEAYEIICIDDGSKDNSLPMLLEYHRKDPRFKVLSLSRNFGHQPAVLAGLNHAKGSHIAIIDGDLQDPPELIKDFYEKMEEGFDVVYAVRKKRKENILKKVSYWAYYRLLGSVSTVDIPLDSGDFSMFRRNVLDYILKMPEQSLFLRGLRSWVGFRQVGFEYERAERQAGEPKYGFKQLFRLAYNGLFSFSQFPIKLLSSLGVSIILFSFIYVIYILIKRLIFDAVPEGFTTLVIFLLFLSGIQLIALGIIGEYVLRIYDETRNRPLFIIQEKHLGEKSLNQ